MADLRGTRQRGVFYGAISLIVSSLGALLSAGGVARDTVPPGDGASHRDGYRLSATLANEYRSFPTNGRQLGLPYANPIKAYTTDCTGELALS